jgi:colicin import membrane protein
MTGVGGSVLVHVIVIAMAIVTPFAASRKVVTNPFWTVNLVSMQELSAGPEMLPKGTISSAGPTGSSKAQEGGRAAGSDRGKSDPMVRVKRLRMDEATSKTETELKKIEAPETPKLSVNPQSAASVEKNLDKLIAKPKTSPKSAPIVQEGKEEWDKGGTTPQTVASKVSTATGGAGTGTGKSTAGQQGGGSEGDRGHPQGGTAAGSGGAQVGLARKLYYTEVWNAIRRQWALPEFLKTQKLETVLIVVVRRDGKVLDIRVEKSSGNDIYDESARRAVRKADPLPVFPEIYSPAQEELGLRFRPEDLS